MPDPAGFKDHFSTRSAGYAAFRPGYPDALFDWLATQCPARDVAWDCATGSGQAAIPLAGRFRRVIATDASRAQIEQAAEGSGVEYRVAPAEASGLEPRSVDLVTVAQALHWLERPRFYAEVRRVSRPGAIVAAWCYTSLRIGLELDRILLAFYDGTVGPYWPPERRHVDAGYRTLEFPFSELEPPEFRMVSHWPLAALIGYLRTWSAVIRYEAERGADPVASLEAELAAHWGDPLTPREIVWPLRLRVGRLEETSRQAAP